MKKTTFGVIVGNRGFFPDVLAKQGRKNILEVLKANGFGSVALSMKETKYGAVETFDDAKKCAALFAAKSDKIDGIIVTLPNFGDEKAVAETIKRSTMSSARANGPNRRPSPSPYTICSYQSVQWALL